MNNDSIEALLNKEKLAEIFPKERSNEFFEALFGDANEGSYDIELTFREIKGNSLILDMLLHERPNCCLACNLTQGLPQVFTRHPVIDIKGVVKAVDTLLGESYNCREWSLGHTIQQSSALHIVPINITVTAQA